MHENDLHESTKLNTTDLYSVKVEPKFWQVLQITEAEIEE